MYLLRINSEKQIVSKGGADLNYNELNRLVNSKINKKELAEIFRHEIDEVSALAQIICLSKELMCYRVVADFSFNGYKVIRNKDISEVVLCDKNDNMNFINSIFVKENLFPEDVFSYSVKSWNELFKKLNSTHTAICVECSFDDAIDYYIGWISDIHDNIAIMKCFDGSGYLFKDDIKVNMNFVSAVMIGDRYTEYMSKYARSLKK